MEWSEGKSSLGAHIYPYQLCTENDDDLAAIRSLSTQLNEYLAVAGTWHDNKHKRDGRVYSWTPKKKTGDEPLASPYRLDYMRVSKEWRPNDER